MNPLILTLFNAVQLAKHYTLPADGMQYAQSKTKPQHLNRKYITKQKRPGKRTNKPSRPSNTPSTYPQNNTLHLMTLAWARADPASPHT